MVKRLAKEFLDIDGQKTAKEIEEYIRRWVDENNAGGIVMGLSGGIDSALLAGLSVRALGKDRVSVYFLHDKNSEEDSLNKARIVSDWLGLELNIGSIEKTMREKEKSAAFFKWLTTMPKFTLPVITGLYYIIVGETPYITILRKNEIRKSKFKRWIYDHIMSGVEAMFDGPCTERRVVLEKIAKEKNLILAGAGNRSEDLTGWFTIDGVDNMPCSPIKCLYKTQVKQLSEYIGVPGIILKRKPSADVLKGADDTLALGMEFDKIDVILYGIERGLTDEEIMICGVKKPQIHRVRKLYHLSAWRRAPGAEQSSPGERQEQDMKEKEEKNHNDYKVVMSDLGESPFRTIRIAFALMGVIPLLVIFYVIIGKNFIYRIFLGNDGLVIGAGIIVSLVGLFYAYDLVKKLMEKLLKYAAERKAADNEKTELLIAVTHDIKTPVAAVKLGIHNLLDGIGGALNKLQGDIAKSCLNAVESVSKFIEEIMNFSKTGLMKMQMKRELINLSDIIKKEVDGIKEIARHNELEVEFKEIAGDANLWADENKISRVVTNLLSNALKYTPKRGRIKTVLSSDENTVKFSVINTGPGIPPQDIDRIFKKYERLSVHSDIDGMGLGLSIVKDIVDLHNGLITVKSDPDKETEFSIILPRDLRTRARLEGLKK